MKKVKLPSHFGKVITGILSDLKKKKDVEAVYLFGSYAQGKAGPLSDLDLAVLIKESKELKESESEVSACSSALVDAVPFHRLPLYIQFEVFKYGRPLFIRNAAYLSQLKLKVLREYLDHVYLYERIERRVLG